ncbi:TolC family protein [Acidovorax sp. CCYZU-2555]|uniref:TolC family protein n=1 Tax=Acidovorax sp. CCYZU-2555 TaxID=2835042 RepID=UPI001BCD4FE0|nr:TolC family protein [Acidovorax sp. CCYZU-2555]MBS7776484.1 TolC family protein [Acidovorax sp. CCYZU-2555]
MKRIRWASPGILAAALLTAAILGHAQTGSAQSPSQTPLRLGFETAWAKQPEQRSAALRRDAAAAGLRAAERWTPQTMALDLSTRSDRWHRNEGSREYEAAVSVPLWSPGERAKSQAAAQSQAHAVDALVGAARWRLADEVREAYWAQQRARIEQQVAQEKLLSAQGIARDVLRRVTAGDLARADAHQADSAVAVAQSAVAEAAVAVAQTAQVWQALTAQELGEGPQEPLPAQTPVADHPALRDLQAKVDLARRQQELAGVQTRANPELSLGTTHERDARGERSAQSINVGVRIPLGRSSVSDARIANASADLLEAQSQLDLEMQRIDSRIALARTRVELLTQARAAAERRATLAGESRGFFDKAFRLGESDLPTRLRIDLEAFEAERQAARSRLEVGAAISQLRQALGLLPE